MRVQLDRDDIDAVCAMSTDGETHTVEYEDGTSVVFRVDVTYDECDIRDLWFDALGELGEPMSHRDTGRDVRPAGFDGAARKLAIGRGHDVWWWQPPADIKGDRDAVDELVRLVCDLLEWGWQVVTLEMVVTDETGTEHTYADSIGGVEPTDDGVRGAIVNYLLNGVTEQRETDEEGEASDLFAAMAAVTGIFAGVPS